MDANYREYICSILILIVVVVLANPSCTFSLSYFIFSKQKQKIRIFTANIHVECLAIVNSLVKLYQLTDNASHFMYIYNSLSA